MDSAIEQLDGQIRVDEETQMCSVPDLLRCISYNTARASNNALFRVLKSYPSFKQRLHLHRFKGQGQRDAYVADWNTCLESSNKAISHFEPVFFLWSRYHGAANGGPSTP